MERRQVTSFQDTRRPPPAIIDKDGRECVGERAAFVRLVEDLPVAQLSPATETDAAGGDSAQRESQQRKLPAGEGARKLHGSSRSGSGGEGVRKNPWDESNNLKRRRRPTESS